MKKISEYRVELDLIKSKVLKQDSQFNKNELQAIQAVVSEIQSNLGQKRKPVDLGCSSCVNNAVLTIRNYIKQIETVEKDVMIVEDKKPTYEGMTLADLREMYPEIKARSIESFLIKLEGNAPN